MATTMEDATAAAAPSPAVGAPLLGPVALPSDPPGERRVPATDATAFILEGAPAPTPQPASPPASSVVPFQPPSTPSTIRVGGPNGSNNVPAYALLAGVLEPTNQVVALPLTRLPATLGKEHETRDRGFVGLKEPPSGEGGAKGAAKLSKSMAVVYYRDRSGGRLGVYKKSKRSGGEVTIDAGDAELDGMTYKPHVVDAGDENETKKAAAAPNPDDILRPSGDAAGSLPSHGFYAIECACRAILVNGRLLKKGQSAVLEHGTPIRMGPYCLYFLLPRPEAAAEGGPPMLRLRTASPAKAGPAKVDNEEREAAASPAKATAKAVAKAMVIEAPPVSDANAAGEATTNPTAGEKTKSSGSGTAKKEEEAAIAPPKKRAKKSTKEIEASLDAQSDSQLLAFLARKVAEEGPWDQEGQKLGAALAVRACTAAARAPSMQRLARAEGGATQRDLVEWMTAPGCPFKDYERLMLTKIEKKSFMMGVGKAIVRAGYAKNEAKSGAGRANRWLLPGMAPPAPAGVEASTGGGGAVVAPLGGGVAAPAKAAEEANANAAPSPAAGGGAANTDVPREPTAVAPGGEKTGP